MKTTSLIFVLVLVSHFAKSKVIVDGVNINKLDSVKYVEVYMVRKGANNALKTAAIDFGQKSFGGYNQTIQDSYGKQRAFKTNMEVLNFMDRNGWEFIQVRLTATLLTIYILKKKE